MLRRLPLVALLGLAAIAGAPAAQAQNIKASNPRDILTVAKSFGSAELTKDSDNDPMIKGTLAGNRYFILFYGCTRNENCRQIEFRGLIERPPRNIDEAMLNEFHVKFRYGKVYFDSDNDVVLSWLVELSGAGVTRRNFESSFEWFRSMNSEFHKYMMAGDSGRRPPPPRDDDRRDTDRRDEDRRRDDDRPPTKDRDASEREPARMPGGVGQQ